MKEDINQECQICTEKKICYILPCCKDKHICGNCVKNGIGTRCPFCRHSLQIETQYVRVVNKQKLYVLVCLVLHVILAALNIMTSVEILEYAIIPIGCAIGIMKIIESGFSSLYFVKYKQVILDYLILNLISLTTKISYIYLFGMYISFFLIKYTSLFLFEYIMDYVTEKKVTNQIKIKIR